MDKLRKLSELSSEDLKELVFELCQDGAEVQGMEKTDDFAKRFNLDLYS